MTKARHWVLARRPIGNDYDSALELIDEALPELKDGQYLLRSRVISMDSGTRMWMTATSPRGQNPRHEYWRGCRQPSSRLSNRRYCSLLRHMVGLLYRRSA